MLSRAYRPLMWIVFLSISIFGCFYSLGSHPIGKADESLYVRSVQEMRLNDSWVPTLHGEPFLHKPPLVHYLMALSVRLFGETNFAYRLPSALSGVLYLLSVPLLAFLLFRSLALSLYSFLAILTCRMLFATHLVREAVTDGILIFLIQSALIVGWLLYEELVGSNNGRKVRLLASGFGAVVFFAILTKSVAGLLPILLWWCFYLLHIRKLQLPLSELLKLFVFTAILPIALSFTVFVSILSQNPDAIHSAGYYEVFEKLFAGGHHNTTKPLYYIWQLFVHQKTFPVFLLVVGLIFGIYKSIHETSYRYLLVATLLPVIAYSFLQSRLYWYIAPIFGPAAILIGAAVHEMTQRFKRGNSLVKASSVFFLVMMSYVGFKQIVDIYQKNILQEKKIPIEIAVIRSINEKHDSGVQIVRYCIDQKDHLYRSLTLRDWIYIDQLAPYAVDTCDKDELASLVDSEAQSVVVSAPQHYQDIPSTVLESSKLEVIDLDNFKGKKRMKKVVQLYFAHVSQELVDNVN